MLTYKNNENLFQYDIGYIINDSINFSYRMIKLLLKRINNIYIDEINEKLDISPSLRNNKYSGNTLYFSNEKHAKSYVDYINSIIIANKLEQV